jgi:hypothetical protein
MFLMFEAMNFIKNLVYMGKGMLAIFIVMGIFIIITYIFNAIFKEKVNK